MGGVRIDILQDTAGGEPAAPSGQIEEPRETAVPESRGNRAELIYTTNAIENFNRQLRKVTKTKSAFVSDDALMKMLYLATMRIIEKWTLSFPNWGLILGELMVYFGDRVPR